MLPTPRRHRLARARSSTTRTALGSALLLAASTALVAGITATQPATAVPSPDGTGSTSVSVFLAPPDLHALERLASQPMPSGAGRAQRLRELARLVPTDAQRDQVEGALRSEGMRIDSAGTWSITATAPASVVTARFGRAAATGRLTSVPASVAPLVSGVYLTSSGPAVFTHHAIGPLSGADVRNADTAAGVAPSTGGKDRGLTIATLQLARFNRGDLASYAASHHLPDPIGSGQFQSVVIGNGPPKHDQFDGEVEVALDQESILSTAPSATQRAYFAPNTNAGYAGVFDRLYGDVVGRGKLTPHPHIMALSVSWGACETLTGAASIKMLQPIIATVVAAGVTIFVASGDHGIYDCGSSNGKGTDNHQADVEYPASSPQVVAVGGSLLGARTSAPNDGTNWGEKVWSCVGAPSCSAHAGTGGGGGGVSGSAFRTRLGGRTDDFAGFAKPLYQARTLLTAPYSKVHRRMVPDIAAAGDPQSGFVVTSSNPDFMAAVHGTTGVVGGTSLAAPLSAAQFTNTLGDAGRRTGLGDIHGALYSAAFITRGLPSTSRLKAFRDIVAGTNGAARDRGADPSVSARPGYDTASGLGGVLWPALRRYLLATHGPAVQGHVKVGRRALTVRWHTFRGTDPIIRAATVVELLRKGRKKPLAVFHTASGIKTVHVPRGKITVVVASWDISRHVTKKVATLTVR